MEGNSRQPVYKSAGRFEANFENPVKTFNTEGLIDKM